MGNEPKRGACLDGAPYELELEEGASWDELVMAQSREKRHDALKGDEPDALTGVHDCGWEVEQQTPMAPRTRGEHYHPSWTEHAGAIAQEVQDGGEELRTADVCEVRRVGRVSVVPLEDPARPCLHVAVCRLPPARDQLTGCVAT